MSLERSYSLAQRFSPLDAYQNNLRSFKNIDGWVWTTEIVMKLVHLGHNLKLGFFKTAQGILIHGSRLKTPAPEIGYEGEDIYWQVHKSDSIISLQEGGKIVYFKDAEEEMFTSNFFCVCASSKK